MHTTSTHSFHHHTIGRLVHNQTIHVSMCSDQKFTGLFSPSLLSETCQMTMNALVCIQLSLLVVKQNLQGYKVSKNLEVILSTNL